MDIRNVGILCCKICDFGLLQLKLVILIIFRMLVVGLKHVRGVLVYAEHYQNAKFEFLRYTDSLDEQIAR